MMGKRVYILWLLPLLLGGCGRDLPQPEEAEAVKTFLSLSLSSQESPATKMTATVVQAASTEEAFRGVEALFVLPFNGADIDGNSVLWGPALQFPGISPSFGSSARGGRFTGLVSGSNARLYRDAYLPRYTAAVLAYGKAVDEAVTGDASTLARKRHNGSLLAPSYFDVGSAADLVFTPEPFLYSLADEYEAWETGLLAYLNSIVTAFGAVDVLSAPAPVLAAFEAFTGKGLPFPASKELLDGRLAALALAMEVYSPSLESERARAADILGALRNPDLVNLADCSLLHSGPLHFGLPAGAVAFQYREGSRSFGTILEKQEEGVGVYTAAPGHYSFPPFLQYGVASPLLASADEAVIDFYDTQKEQTWSGVLAHYPDAVVMADSRAVALQKPLQYGVARFDLSLNPATFMPLALSYPLTGVLVAGQQSAGYAFHPIPDSPERIVYDGDVLGASGTPRAWLGASNGGAEIPVLLMETQAGADVHLALEFLNSGTAAFTGFNGTRIEPGMHFYLLGTLEFPDDPDEGVTAVFMQDHKTTVRFTVQDLKNAHAVLPDIREVQLSLGLNAQMNWMQDTPIAIEIQ